MMFPEPGRKCAGREECPPGNGRSRPWWIALALLAGCGLCGAQTELPDAPQPAAQMLLAAAGVGGAGQETFPPQAQRRRGVRVPGLDPGYTPVPEQCRSESCSMAQPQRSCCAAGHEDFTEYLRQIGPHIYTPKELGRLAVHGVIDPFNVLTIAYTSGLSVATDPDSPYGPGMKGFAKVSGVLLTQDMTGEFFGTFLLPSLTHQDPHFHREPNASIPRRILHCIYQVFWTQSDTGQGMVNYATIAGVPAEEAVGSLYIPYRQIGWKPSAERVGTDWATAPIGNFVTEFVPDVARHVNFHVVLVQRIINRVALEEGGGAP